MVKIEILFLEFDQTEQYQNLFLVVVLVRLPASIGVRLPFPEEKDEVVFNILFNEVGFNWKKIEVFFHSQNKNYVVLCIQKILRHLPKLRMSSISSWVDKMLHIKNQFSSFPRKIGVVFHLKKKWRFFHSTKKMRLSFIFHLVGLI